ncbi:PREDICTED: uncharacterized protein LOC104817199 [Tarenaya hassleriana]|uniref:uncharacterized protein LOC104817199 n=1 Tax=Tarenaya hassleriana TaxID=28532 RepID=UPI00053C09F8|nr:PREDICTED: uncharacterized protein LOC104817199 [Tarenaya hassleriana]
MMEEQSGAGGGGSTHWWWVAGSAAQFMWGVRSYRRGYAGDSRLMPVKAFGVASLFVCAFATASVGFLHASGIHKVEDAVEAGANLRTSLGIPSRTPKKEG